MVGEEPFHFCVLRGVAIPLQHRQYGLLHVQRFPELMDEKRPSVLDLRHR
jgi:hypothetical protein